MYMKKTTIEIPQDVYDQFRVRCIKNHSSVKDEFTQLICESLKNKPQSEVKSEKEPQQTVVIDGKEYVDDIDDPLPPFIQEEMRADQAHLKKGDLKVELKPILGMVEKLTLIVQSQKADLDTLRGRLESPQNCPKLEKFDVIEKNFAIVGKLIQSLGEAIIQDTGGKWCLDDIKGIRALGVEPSQFSMEHSKK